VIIYFISCVADYETVTSSYDESLFTEDSGYSLPTSEMEDGGEDSMNEYWQPFINLKLNAQGQVLLQGSSIELYKYENDRLLCIQEYDDVLFLSEKTPILEASSWWSFYIQPIPSEQDPSEQDPSEQDENTEQENQEEIESTAPCFSKTISFHFGVGDIQMESLAVWDNINWDGIETLQPSEIEYSAFIEIQEGQYWTYGIAVEDSQWLLLRPGYRFPFE
jgi:hypothetical protein